MSNSMPREGADRLALSIAEACTYISIGRTTLYKLIRENQIPIRKVGARTIVLRDELDQALKSFPRERSAS